MINGLIGRRRRTDDVVELNPLVSNNTWDHFCLDRVPYRGKMLPILWYKIAPPYGKGTGVARVRPWRAHACHANAGEGDGRVGESKSGKAMRETQKSDTATGLFALPSGTVVPVLTQGAAPPQAKPVISARAAQPARCWLRCASSTLDTVTKTSLGRKLLVCLLLLRPAVLHGAPAADSPEQPSTFCNPLSLPNYPVGRAARGVKHGDPDPQGQWKTPHKEQFRELADVSALWHDGRWFLYPSVDMAWVSADNGATWQHHPLNVRDIGYAPTVVRHRGKFLLLASGSPIYRADSPLGPFIKLGSIQLVHTESMPAFIDPMLFADDDGALYYYWGCSPAGGIWGVQLDADDPTKALTAPAELIPFRSDLHPWEAVGEWNQNPRVGWLEGAWMLKRNGRYYLTYSAGGTEHRTYAMGCYVGSKPLGPFTPQKRNPILRTVQGLVTGTAHGCVVAGPADGLWAFYTIRAGVAFNFERRLGMDRAAIDPHGELVVYGATALPQWLPGMAPTNAKSRAPDWLPLNGEVRTIGSTTAPNLQARFAADDDMRTWWQPADGDTNPMLTSTFMAPATVHAVRLIWRDVGLDTERGVQPGAFRYRVELETGTDQWTTILDRSRSEDDLLVDYRQCSPTKAGRVRLVIVGWPSGIQPAIAEFTVFGKTIVP